MPGIATKNYESVCQSHFKQTAQAQFLWFTQQLDYKAMYSTYSTGV